MDGKNLRPSTSLSVRGRSFAHWTPAYLTRRIRSKLRERFHPEEPSFTPQAVALLEGLLRPGDIGVEWGSGNSTRWFARRTRHLTSFESAEPYYNEVKASLHAAGLSNVDQRLVALDADDDEQAIHRTPWMTAARAFPDASLDYALVDTYPRGCLCATAVAKLRPGGLLIVDNANWWMPPPPDVYPPAMGSVPVLAGTPGSAIAKHECWPAFSGMTADWRRHWSSDGVQMTLVLFKN